MAFTPDTQFLSWYGSQFTLKPEMYTHVTDIFCVEFHNFNSKLHERILEECADDLFVFVN